MIWPMLTINIFPKIQSTSDIFFPNSKYILSHQKWLILKTFEKCQRTQRSKSHVLTWIRLHDNSYRTSQNVIFGLTWFLLINNRENNQPGWCPKNLTNYLKQRHIFTFVGLKHDLYQNKQLNFGGKLQLSTAIIIIITVFILSAERTFTVLNT